MPYAKRTYKRKYGGGKGRAIKKRSYSKKRSYAKRPARKIVKAPRKMGMFDGYNIFNMPSSGNDMRRSLNRSNQQRQSKRNELTKERDENQKITDEKNRLLREQATIATSWKQNHEGEEILGKVQEFGNSILPGLGGALKYPIGAFMQMGGYNIRTPSIEETFKDVAPLALSMIPGEAVLPVIAGITSTAARLPGLAWNGAKSLPGLIQPGLKSVERSLRYNPWKPRSNNSEMGLFEKLEGKINGTIYRLKRHGNNINNSLEYPSQQIIDRMSPKTVQGPVRGFNAWVGIHKNIDKKELFYKPITPAPFKFLNRIDMRPHYESNIWPLSSQPKRTPINRDIIPFKPRPKKRRNRLIPEVVPDKRFVGRKIPIHNEKDIDYEGVFNNLLNTPINSWEIDNDGWKNF